MAFKQQLRHTMRIAHVLDSKHRHISQYAQPPFIANPSAPPFITQLSSPPLVTQPSEPSTLFPGPAQQSLFLINKFSS
jgi:hypothetical protein